MKRFRMPRCPYCGDRLNAAQAWALRRRGEYICPRCGGLSNVVLDPLLRGLGSLAVLLAAAFFTAGLFLGLEHAPWVLSGVLLPFLAFYAVCVFLVRLRKPAAGRRRRRPGGVSPQAPGGVSPQAPGGVSPRASARREERRGPDVRFAGTERGRSRA